MDALRSAYDTALASPPDEPDVPEASYNVEISVWLDVDLPDRLVAPEAHQRDLKDLRDDIATAIQRHTFARVTETETLEVKTP